MTVETSHALSLQFGKVRIFVKILKMSKTIFFNWLFTVSVLLILSACHHRAPVNSEDICAIFKEKESWYEAALATQKKWGIPVYIPMAIMYQESAFKFDAKPPMTYLFDLIPTGRISSAYGFSQAKVDTWLDYVKETGNSWSSRDDFDDAIDFMGWYISKASQRNKISKSDAYNQYLNYHEGWTGFKRKTYKKKTWLITVARKVEKRAKRYQSQYKVCQKELDEEDSWFYYFN